MKLEINGIKIETNDINEAIQLIKLSSKAKDVISQEKRSYKKFNTKERWTAHEMQLLFDNRNLSVRKLRKLFPNRTSKSLASRKHYIKRNLCGTQSLVS